MNNSHLRAQMVRINPIGGPKMGGNYGFFFKISGICGKSFHSGIWGLSKTAPWEFSLMRFLEMAVFIREARCRRGFAASRQGSPRWAFWGNASGCP